jgi:hypothetical protein
MGMQVAVKVISAKHRFKFAAISLGKVTGATGGLVIKSLISKFNDPHSINQAFCKLEIAFTYYTLRVTTRAGLEHTTSR